MKRVKPVGIGIWFGLVWSGLGVPLRPFESWPRTIRLKSVSGRVGWLVGQSVSRSVSRSVGNCVFASYESTMPNKLFVGKRYSLQFKSI